MSLCTVSAPYGDVPVTLTECGATHPGAVRCSQ